MKMDTKDYYLNSSNMSYMSRILEELGYLQWESQLSLMEMLLPLASFEMLPWLPI